MKPACVSACDKHIMGESWRSVAANLDLRELMEPLVTRYDDLFDKMVVVDYHGGPYAGIGRIAKDCSAYEFQILDQSDDTEILIMRLTRLPDAAFDCIVTLCSQSEMPLWPIWTLGYQNPDENTRQVIDREYAAIAIDPNAAPDYIVAWRNSDHVILSINMLDAQVWSDIGYKAHEFDWFGFLGLG